MDVSAKDKLKKDKKKKPILAIMKMYTAIQKFLNNLHCNSLG